LKNICDVRPTRCHHAAMGKNSFHTARIINAAFSAPNADDRC
jgi:hypothetical protein